MATQAGDPQSGLRAGQRVALECPARNLRLDLWTLSDLCTPWCIRVVATLHIAEHIASGVTDIAALATATASDTDALHSVLSYLVARGVFIEELPGRFALNETARGLLNPGLFLSLDGIGGTHGPRLEHAAGVRPHRQARVRRYLRGTVLG